MEEILRWLGLPGSIVVAFVGISGVFKALENIASKERKAGLSDFLRSADWTVVPFKLTAAFREVFEAVFGANQFSAKCLRRSIAFSLIAIITLLALGFLNHYSYFHTMPGVILHKPGFRIIFFGWLLWSMVIDFFNLYKTRLLIRLIDRVQISIFLFFGFIALDLAISFFVFVVSYGYLDALNMASQFCAAGRCSIWREIGYSFWFVGMMLTDNGGYWLDKLVWLRAGPTANEIAVFFFAGLLPTLWLLLYVLATGVVRFLVKISDLISFTVSWLDIDRPFEAIGFIAASMVSIFIAVRAAIVYLLTT